MPARPRAVARALTTLAALPLLAVTAPAHADDDPAHDPVVDCSTYWRYNGVLAWAGVATVPAGHGGVRQLIVTCTYSNEVGRYTSWHEAPAPVVVTYGAAPLAAGSMKVCGSAVVFYQDGHVGTAPETCTS